MRLRPFNISWTILGIFYESVVSSVILFAVVCTGNRLRATLSNMLNKLILKAADVVGVKLDSLKTALDRRML